jgi:hypothetical protein
MTYRLTEHWRRWTRRVLISFALTFPLLVARSQFLTGDGTYYVGLAQSLASGHGYTLMGQPHTTYPPGLPLLLAPFAALGGANVVLMQIVIAAFAAVSLVAVLAFLSTYDPRAELIVGVLATLSFSLFSLATTGIRTELPYLAASAFALRLVWSPPEKIGASWALVVLSGLTVATVLFRTIGTVLPAAFLIAWVHRRIRRCPRTWTDRALLVGGGVGLLTACLWFAWTTTKGSSGYVGLLLMNDPHQPDLGTATVASMLARIPTSLAIQITHLAELATGMRSSLATWLSPVTVALAALLGIGLSCELRGQIPVLGWYVMGYWLILLVWPFDEGVRFVLPIFPFSILLVWRGSIWALRRAHVDSGATGSSSAGDGEAASHRRSGWLAVAAVALSFLAMILLRVQDFPLRSRQGSAIAAGWLIICAIASYLWRSGRSIHLGSWARRTPILFLACYATLNLAHTVPDAASQFRGHDTGAVGMRPAIEWLRHHAAPGDVIMAQFAEAVYFYTGLNSVRMPVTRDRRALLIALRESRATYLLINDTPESPYYYPTEVERFALLQAEAGSEQFDLVYRFPAGTIYRVL